MSRIPHISEPLFDAGTQKVNDNWFRFFDELVPIIGAWRPTLAGSSTAGTQTYSVQVGTYARVGPLVYVGMRLTLTAKDVLTSGNLQINGLPFAARAQGSVAVAVYALSVGVISNVDLATGYSQFTAQIAPGNRFISLSEAGDNVASQALTDADFGATTAINISGCYLA